MRVRTHTNPLACTKEFTKLDIPKIYPNFTDSLDFEIGFGQSSFIRNYAQTNPGRLVIGIDVRKKTFALMEEKVKAENIPNIHLVHGNALRCLEQMFNDQSIDNMFIFHPDPWIKRKHHKRRLINEQFVAIVQKKLKLNGKIYVSTDVKILWEQICHTFDHSGFVQIQDDVFWATYATRWHTISLEKNRPTYFSTFCRTK
jgi:tRNA (guanine-N(7)-)-methyltransferase